MFTTGRTIHVARDRWHLAWDNSIAPVATAGSGAVVEFDLLDASCGQIGPDATVQTVATLDFARVDQVNGPIFVEGAAPGDTLQVEFLELQPAEWGWTAIIPGFGLLAEEFPEPALKMWRLADGWAEFAPGVRIPLEPFCGEIGLAPGAPSALSTIPPYRHGGNMDTKHLTQGATLYLPVETEGALFSLGDGHAAQGDGEVCGTGIECGGDVTLCFGVQRGRRLVAPEYRTPAQPAPGPRYATTGVAPDLMAASQDAVRGMIAYLQAEHGLSAANAYILCSVAVDLSISEIVDAPNWVVSASLPLGVLDV